MGECRSRPSAEARRDDYAARNDDSYEFMSPWDRCITRGIPGSMFPAGYNNAYQIIQTPGYVTIHYEMIHDARIIPLDNRPRSARMQTWMGEPRGRWDGDTLVVETTNYNNKGWITTSPRARASRAFRTATSCAWSNDSGASSKDVINYSATIEDPEIYTQAVDHRVSAHRGSGLSHLRVRLPRGELRDREHPAGREGAREGRAEEISLRCQFGRA